MDCEQSAFMHHEMLSCISVRSGHSRDSARLPFRFLLFACKDFAFLCGGIVSGVAPLNSVFLRLLSPAFLVSLFLEPTAHVGCCSQCALGTLTTEVGHPQKVTTTIRLAPWRVSGHDASRFCRGSTLFF
jgi:hypothetical protein